MKKFADLKIGDYFYSLAINYGEKKVKKHKFTSTSDSNDDEEIFLCSNNFNKWVPCCKSVSFQQGSIIGTDESAVYELAYKMSSQSFNKKNDLYKLKVGDKLIQYDVPTKEFKIVFVEEIDSDDALFIDIPGEQICCYPTSGWIGNDYSFVAMNIESFLDALKYYNDENKK